MLKQFRFKNFKPSHDLAIKANLALFESVDCVPYGALSEAIMTKNDNKYYCHLEIVSHEKPFAVKAISTDPYVALKRGTEKIKDQVARWQTKRFIEPLLSLVHIREFKVQQA